MSTASAPNEQTNDPTKHAWRTIHSTLNDIELECVNCGDRTNNAMLAHIYTNTCKGRKPEDQMVRELAASFGGTVESYKVRASGAPAETPQTFAAKLREIGYQEPVLTKSVTATTSAESRGDTTLEMKYETIGAATCTTRNCGQIAREGSTMCRDCSEETESMRRYILARDEYLRALKLRPTFWSKCRALLSRIWGGLSLIAAVFLTTLGCIAMAHGQEVPDRIVAAVAMVETGATWRDTGDIKGDWSHGRAGEISHWQITGAVLDDMGISSKERRKVATDPVYAESVFRLWYSRLLARTGSHEEALAAYHRGLGGRHRSDARDYARRVLNLAGL